MTIRRAPRAVTESAVHHLHASYLDHVHAFAAVPRARGRILTSTTAFGSYDSGAASRQGCLLRLISVVEAYIDTLSSALFRETVPTSDELVLRLVDSAQLLASTSWSERHSAFENYHGIKLRKLDRWSELDAGIEVRNAIAHGLGWLTRRQRTKSITGKLSQLGIIVRDGGIVITESSLKNCRDACVDFVNSLDRCAPPETRPR